MTFNIGEWACNKHSTMHRDLITISGYQKKGPDRPCIVQFLEAYPEVITPSGGQSLRSRI
ncbi:hypothetical protein RvY_07762 [Ramazzottius varieornatus]|uniref:Uncharacterized protein n=1 Tax=Ramazzottius varieornatus TaxID=947166 RepID=A0A1D1VCR5_RAMVA|nr:hypothetical protein RvY_07762 [Ramazzottius varieornatus]